MQGYTVKTKDSIITFMNKSDYDLYMDYINNGLKVVRKKDNTYYFNDGSRLLDIPTRNGMNEVRVLTKRNKKYTNERYFKKYLQAIDN